MTFLTKQHKFIITALLLWQVVSIYLIAIGPWTSSVVWVNFGLILLYVLLAPTFEALLLVVASIPFYVVLPQHYSDTLSMWRPVVGVLFLKAGLYQLLSLRARESSSVRSNLASLLGLFRLPRSQNLPRNDGGGIVGYDHFSTAVKKWFQGLFGYEKVVMALLALAVVSIMWATYRVESIKQIIFLINAALLYFVVVWAVKSREQFIKLLQFGALSTGAIVVIGYIQFIATLFGTAYYFWQFWALRVASLYYGLPLAKVLQYSNSWVTVQGEEKVLRMFSIMTSSHAFAMVCVLFLAFVLPLLAVSSSRKRVLDSRLRGNDRWGRGNDNAVWLCVAIVLACWAIIFSGTRGVWLGMVPALVVAWALYYTKQFRYLVKPVFAAMLVVFILFTASPLTDRGLAWVRSAGQGTLDRVASIVDPNETSNAGRLAMWKTACKYALHHPLGVGYGNFLVSLTGGKLSYQDAASQDNDAYQLPQQYVTAHSLYLQLIVELSVVGLLLFGMFWLLYFYKAYEYLKKAAYAVTPETVYIATLSIIFLWFLAYSVFDLTWLNDKILLYTFVAFGLARVVFKFPHPEESDK